MNNHIYKLNHSILGVAIIVFIFLFVTPERVVHAGSAETFVVNSQGDEGDADTSDDVCSTTLLPLRAGGGAICTLRAAIEQANARPFEMDSIIFKINGFVLPFAPTIEPDSPLPTITAPVVIDGTTQPVGLAPPICTTSVTGGAHNILVTLDGISAGSGSGLRISATAPGTRIKGLAIINFPGSGIYSYADSTEIRCNHIGIERDGVTAAGNGENGITFLGGNNQKVGSITAKDRNVISGNENNGIHIQASSDNSSIYGNYIGVDEDAATAVPNAGSGIYIIQSTDTNIGSVLGLPNVISGNGVHGIQIHSSSSEATKIYRNLIGTDRTGTAAIGNTLDGIKIEGGQQTEIGGVSMVSLENVISGNHRHGINLRFGASETSIYDNLIGTQISPGLPLPNGGNGIEIIYSESNYIGGSEIGNTIAFNNGHGIKMRDNANNNYVADNLIRANGGNGIDVEQGSDNQIGEHGSGNTILGNTAHGIIISGTLSSGSVVQGNNIGYDLDLAVADGNGGNGIFVRNAPDTIIGTATSSSGSTRAVGASNIIGSNAGNGIHISGSSSSNTQVDGNIIGTDLPLEADLGNGGHGILIDNGASSNQIGDTLRNVVAFNADDGISIVGMTSAGNSVRKNIIKRNGGLMIDLGNDGETANDADDSDVGANDLQNRPRITNRFYNGDTIIITGTLTTGANESILLDVYIVDNCDDGVADGTDYFKTESITSDSNGVADFSIESYLVSRAISFGFVAMTATNMNNSTSEFSDCIHVSSVPLAVSMISAETISPNTVIPLLTTALLVLTIQPLRSKRHSRP